MRGVREQDLAGQVEVVRPGRHARIDQLQTGGPVRADRRRHHPRVARHRRERSLVAASATTSGQSTPSRAARAFELVARAAGEPDRHAVGSVLGQVAGDEPPDEARRAEDDDVHAAGPCHAEVTLAG